MLRWVAALVTVAQAAAGACAARPCDGVDTALSPGRRRDYARLVASAVTTHVDPSAVHFRTFMASGSWSAIYAAMPGSEDGVFFFQDSNGQQRFREVWGGWADPSDKPELTRRARQLGAPADLAACFADVVTRH